jgi:DNA-binding MarR family transcriptional regulator
MAAASLVHPRPAEPTPGRALPDDADIALAGELGRALTRLVRAVSRARAQGLTGEGALDTAAVPALVALSEQGPLRASVLAEVTLSDPSTISRQVAHLAELGFVERRRDPQDGRACLLAITAAGKEALAERRRSRDEYLARVMTGWSERDRRRVAALVDRLATDVARNLHRTPEPASRRLTQHSEENQ